MRVAILFTDGVGVGTRDPSVNPLARADYLLSQFADGTGTLLPSGGSRHDVDTTFGIPGRPQSASNQTAIFTAQPAPALLGRHLLGYPNQTLRELLAKDSIVRRITDAGKSATFANSYPVEYLDALGLQHRPSLSRDIEFPERLQRRFKASASTLAMAAAGVSLRTLDDARNHEGLTHDIDGSSAIGRRLIVPRRSPSEAAGIFWKLSVDFTLFEHFLADEAGHAQDFIEAQRALSTFDAFARAVIEQMPAQTQLLICSDHGNVEDLSSRSHTRNAVAVLCFGVAQPLPMHTVADVGKTALSWLGLNT